ncbi:TIGR02680 family protein [Nocardia cyriacigeorgica]|nr:TIGR02680 family protein [Nocardia cyriacigeorgica]MBF6455522.1 TIGR02680 family protein [Nocardia cyriacigeorgica]MBF6480590.1 TIGR02680 family protein [Nocardia cyriacigeorgica]MBF6553736.1 TIGR02680 family protein [Nocardia cyriacigeorgica]
MIGSDSDAATTPDEVATEWLRSATSGGLPTPGRERWQPLRVGIANLWEYDDAEFWFADGRLVLRGGNGTGKTKVLELTTLMLLRGEIAPSVLDPFGSQHRTMSFNLLPSGDGDDPREPADAGLGYTWVEFGRRTREGAPQYYVCGLGASARRGAGSNSMSTWRFVTRLRPGSDFRLTTAGVALERKDLEKIDGISVISRPEVYRDRLAKELFGLPPESYDNLTELLKQLRKPKLGERLNPAGLATTLRDALPPLAAHEINQLADGWEHLEQLRAAMQRTEEAAHAIAVFVRTGWRPWALRVMRRRADEMAAATTRLDYTTSNKKAAEVQLDKARSSLTAAEEHLEDATSSQKDSETALRELMESQSYRDAVAATGRITALRQELAGLKSQHSAAEARLQRERASASKASTRVDSARAEAQQAGEAVAGAARAIESAAAGAGLTDAVARHLAHRDIDALTGEFHARQERFAHLQVLATTRVRAERRVERSGQVVHSALSAVEKARDDEAAALVTVQKDVEILSAQVRAWAVEAEVASCTDVIVGEWCDLVAEMTVIDEENELARPTSVIEEMRAHVGRSRSAWTADAEGWRLERSPLATRRDATAAQLADVRLRRETAPPAPALWHRRERPDAAAMAGAPLWRLVNPVSGLDEKILAVLESTLAASGLLDAWVSPNGAVNFAEADLSVTVDNSADDGRPNLLVVLEPATYGGVSATVVQRILTGIAWRDRGLDAAELGGVWFAADGCWRVGALAGRADPAGPAAYIGAAAREAARARLIARLEFELAELDQLLSVLDNRLRAADDALARLDDEERALPVDGERKVTAGVIRWAERCRATASRAAEYSAAEREHATQLTRRDQAVAEFAEFASTHQFGMDDLDKQRDALTEFRTRVNNYSHALTQLDTREKNLDDATDQLTERERERELVEKELREIEVSRRERQVRLQTAEHALRADHREQLERRKAIEAQLLELRTSITEYTTALTDAKAAEARAEEVLRNHEERRAEAEIQRDSAMTALWEAVDDGLTQPLGLTLPERQNVQSAREIAATIRREVTTKSEQADEQRAWRTCLQKLEELRQSLLPQQDARVLDEDDTLPRVEIHSDAVHGFQLPYAAADTLAERVAEQRRSYDAEQQRVLATLLGSTFIEHLKDRLDYTTRTFTNINNHLAEHPTRQGHAVRVVCAPDPSDHDAEAVVGALGQGYNELSPGRQEMVREFLARKIDEARSAANADGTADWKEQLTTALDYRRWLEIGLQYRPGSTSRWARFDAAKHGAKSGGEKVVLLSQPLFAAAVVAYDAADEHCPRWVWLDEAMTGVDAQVKASFMGLTVDFELDIMLTAHDEWCNYNTVPAVAIYDLARERHLPGVDALPYLWCGGTLTELSVDRLGVVEQPQPTADEGLLGLLDG